MEDIFDSGQKIELIRADLFISKDILIILNQTFVFYSKN